MGSALDLADLLLNAKLVSLDNPSSSELEFDQALGVLGNGERFSQSGKKKSTAKNTETLNMIIVATITATCGKPGIHNAAIANTAAVILTTNENHRFLAG